MIITHNTNIWAHYLYVSVSLFCQLLTLHDYIMHTHICIMCTAIYTSKNILKRIKPILRPSCFPVQEVTQRIMEVVGSVAGSSLEQTSWLSRNLEVKAQPQICLQESEDEQEGNDLYGTHITLLSEIYKHFRVFYFTSLQIMCLRVCRSRQYHGVILCSICIQCTSFDSAGWSKTPECKHTSLTHTRIT